MAISFREIRFYNDNSLPITVTLEVPVGTTIYKHSVAGKSNVGYAPNLTDVKAVKMTATPADHDHPYTDSETITLSGTPHASYIETVECRSVIGSLTGSFTASFSR